MPQVVVSSSASQTVTILEANEVEIKSTALQEVIFLNVVKKILQSQF